MATASTLESPIRQRIEATRGVRPEADDDLILPDGDASYEVVDGRVVELPPMGFLQSQLAFRLAFRIESVALRNGLGSTFTEGLFRIDPERKIRRKPDAAFVSARKWPIGKRVPEGEFWDMVPDLAVEVVSPSDAAVYLDRKIEDYFAAGVAQVWVVFSETRKVYVYTSTTEVRILKEPAELDGADLIPGFRLALGELFGEEEVAGDAAPNERRTDER